MDKFVVLIGDGLISILKQGFLLFVNVGLSGQSILRRRLPNEGSLASEAEIEGALKGGGKGPGVRCSVDCVRPWILLESAGYSVCYSGYHHFLLDNGV